jgi:3-carboxy-cis,cis-muconate cycloisomerase
MAENVAFALGTKLGNQAAHRLVEESSRKAIESKRDLQDVLAENDEVRLSMTVGELARLFEPMAYQGVAQTLIDRIIGSLQGRGGKRST